MASQGACLPGVGFSWLGQVEAPSTQHGVPGPAAPVLDADFCWEASIRALMGHPDSWVQTIVILAEETLIHTKFCVIS